MKPICKHVLLNAWNVIIQHHEPCCEELSRAIFTNWDQETLDDPQRAQSSTVEVLPQIWSLDLYFDYVDNHRHNVQKSIQLGSNQTAFHLHDIPKLQHL